MNIIIEEHEQNPQTGHLKNFYFQSKKNKTYALTHLDSMTLDDQRDIAIKILEQPRNQRKSEDLQLLRKVMIQGDFLQQFQMDNDHEAIDYIFKTLSVEHFYQNQLIYSAGDLAYKIYIVMEGQVLLYNQNELQVRGNRRHSQSMDYSRETAPNHRNKSSDIKLRNITRLQQFEPISVFGENSIIEGRKRHHNAIAVKKCALAVLLKDDYKVAYQMIEKKKQIKSMLSFKQNQCLQGMNKKLLNILLFTFNSIEYRFREYVYHQFDSTTDSLYIVKQGDFQCFRTKPIRQQIAVLSAGQLFGDQEAFTGIPRQYSVQCVSDNGVVIQIPLSQLRAKLQSTNELHLLNQLQSICQSKNQWHSETIRHNEDVSENFKQYLSWEKNDPSTEIRKLNLTAEVPTSSVDNQELYMTNLESAKSTLPKVKLISSYRQSDRAQITTPERLDHLVKSKLSIICKLNNLSQEQSKHINLSTFQQQTILVSKPKTLQVKNNSPNWPIKTYLYLNNLDSSPNKCCRAISVMNSVSNKAKDESRKINKLNLLKHILEQQFKPKAKRKKRALTLGFRQYLEQTYDKESTLIYS